MKRALELVLLVLFCFVWLAATEAHAAQPVPTDADWPTIQQMPMVPVLVGYNVFGDKIVLYAQFCGGDYDNARSTHMHVYGIYGHSGAFIQGGCWKYEPAVTRATRKIQYFDIDGNGWDVWPLTAFHAAK